MEAIIDDHSASLIGFALKSHQLSRGFGAVRKAVLQNKIAIVFVENSISGNSYNKLKYLLSQNKVPLIRTAASINWNALWGMHGSKIMGISKGNIGRVLMQKFYAGE